MLLTWLLFGAIIGFVANFLEFFSSKQSMITSVGLGVVGAMGGGLFGEAIHAASIGSFASPLLYIIAGAFMLAVLPMLSRRTVP